LAVKSSTWAAIEVLDKLFYYDCGLE
jgi:hypothetical protein